MNPDRDITEINPRNILPDHRRPRIPNSRFRDYIISSVNTHQVDYPTYSQAMKSSDRLKWEEAISRCGKVNPGAAAQTKGYIRKLNLKFKFKFKFKFKNNLNIILTTTIECLLQHKSQI